MCSTAAIVLAAGFGSRMGADKLRLSLGHCSILGHTLRAYAGHSLQRRILVVRPDLPLPPEAASWEVVFNEHASRGMGSSLRVGVAAAPAGCTGFLLGLGDLPALRPSTVAAVLQHAEHAPREGQCLHLSSPLFRRAFPGTTSATARCRRCSARSPSR